MANVPFQILKDRVQAGVALSIEEAATQLHAKVVENASLTDHTLDDLQKLGHPYAVRNNNLLHGYRVHAQSGNLRDNIELEKVSSTHYRIKIDPVKVPYIDAVIYGTRYMVARDFITGSFNEMKPKMRLLIAARLKEVFNRRFEAIKSTYKNVRDRFGNR